MELVQQLIDENGLQIPLPLMSQYGLQPGSAVTVELDDDVIRIVPKFPDQTAIENRALRLLLKSLGDAILVKAQQLAVIEPDGQQDGWRVDVYAHGLAEPLGYLDYSRQGQLRSDLKASLATIRQNAGKLVATA